LNAAANRGGNAGDVGRFRVAGDERRVERKRGQLGAVVSPSGERVELIFKGPTQKHLVAKREFHRRNSGKKGKTGKLEKAERDGGANVALSRLLILMTKSARVVGERRREPSRLDEARRVDGGLVERN
jgi:hypothetical protein